MTRSIASKCSCSIPQRIFVRGHALKILLLGILLFPTLLGCGAPSAPAGVSAEFPITIYPEWIYVPVTIGTSEHLCVVDSGTGGYIFDTTLRQTLGASVGNTPISLPDGSLSRAEKIKAPDAHIGSISLNKDALALCYDLSSMRKASGRDIHGIVGLPLFQSYIVQMDFDAHRILICSPSMCRRQIGVNR